MKALIERFLLKTDVPKTLRIRTGLGWKEVPGQNFISNEVTAFNPAGLLTSELFHRYFTKSEPYF